MADIRINSLPTTASSTASDDFLGVDGSANGTRKLNAYSPSFGGTVTAPNVQAASSAGLSIKNNSGTETILTGAGSGTGTTLRGGVVMDSTASISGTLTVTGATSVAANLKSSVSSSGSTGGILLAENTAAAATGNQASVFFPTSTGASTYWQLIGRQNSATANDQTLRVVFGGVAQHTYFNASDLSTQSGITLKVLDTTASTSTSTGALVVGSSGSGGLGVAGSANIGGNLNVIGTGPHIFQGAVNINVASGDIQHNLLRSSVTKAIIGVTGSAGNIVADSAADDLVLRTTSAKALRVTTDGGSNSALTVTQALTTVAGNLTVNGTGTSTISGDLTITGAGGGVTSIGRNGLNGLGAAGVLSVTSDAQTAADAIGLTFIAKDSASNAQTYATIRALIEDPTSTSEDGAIQLLTVSAGTLAEKARLTSTGNLLIGGTTDISGSGGLKVFGTTASVDTSSGALIVSGGVGVAGAINGGSSITLTGGGNFGGTLRVSPSSGTAYGRFLPDPYRADVFQLGSNWTGGAQDDATKPSWYWFFDSRSAGDSTILYRNPAGGASAAALTISSTTATFAGNLTVSGTGTSSFAGPIAIANTVNSVSPTSPNRTITMVIGGTTYYLHAKTTND